MHTGQTIENLDRMTERTISLHTHNTDVAHERSTGGGRAVNPELASPSRPDAANTTVGSTSPVKLCRNCKIAPAEPPLPGNEDMPPVLCAPCEHERQKRLVSTTCMGRERLEMNDPAR